MRLPRNFRVIGGLILPFGAIVFGFSVFSVALPSIRSEFDLAPDTASWLLLVHSIAYVVLMPLYGRLGDKYGAKRLILAGMGLFAFGTMLCIFAQTMGVLFVGRITQAAGASGVNPLSLSILTRVFPPGQRGKAIGSWTTSGPFVTVVGRLVGGYLVESFGWRSALVPALIVTIFAAPALILAVPNIRATDRDSPRSGINVVGMVITSLFVTSIVLFVSSRAVTGRTAFTDVRLLLLLVGSGVAWMFAEIRAVDPFVPFSLLRNREFSAASWLAFVRMTMLGSLFFLTPLYVVDVMDADASAAGFLLALHALALLLTTRFGASYAESQSRRIPIVTGMFIQCASLAAVGLLRSPGMPVLSVLLALNGVTAGLSLASLHQVAMDGAPSSEYGVTAGTYSMIRVLGVAISAAISGVALERFISGGLEIALAFRLSFVISAAIGLLGAVPSLFLRYRSP